MSMRAIVSQVIGGFINATRQLTIEQVRLSRIILRSRRRL